MARPRVYTASKSTLQNTGRYVQGGLTDQYSDRAGWWERYPIADATDDIQYVIPPEHDRRPDLVAKRVYNQVGLTWLVLQYNNIVDIETEFRAGRELLLPSQRRTLLNIMVRSAGGNPV